MLHYLFGRFAFLDLGAPELVVILAILLLLFGGKKLPELSRSLGESMRELRKGLSGDIKDDHKDEKKEKTEPKDKDVAA
ncbi:twin-arginine translocase TatA/TatE family subunit [Acidithrix ferrooxidans]|uniref:Sec-independent protein translocase protein TatA n=1 Tax=Acidithrix ferrooxidans TaxID=1280514 RepID=A0A0D8HJL2_9ACTN|nr:twin-arginine translocase TatA/TatE family subunit [Acidithrix ferrooxidans]KJF18054.1 Sec-independent protein translocase protein TatAd [Acidithrix ferrooxidans]